MLLTHKKRGEKKRDGLGRGCLFFKETRTIQHVKTEVTKMTILTTGAPPLYVIVCVCVVNDTPSNATEKKSPVYV